MNVFQLARGYLPSIAGIAGGIVTEDMLKDHICFTASRAMQRAITSHIPTVIPADMLRPGDKIWDFYKSSKPTEHLRWLIATVIKFSNHYVECRTKTEGPAIPVAHEYVELAPNNQLARDVMNISLEGKISDNKWNGPFLVEGLQKASQEGDVLNQIFGDNDEIVSDIEKRKPIGASSTLLNKIFEGVPENDVGKL